MLFHLAWKNVWRNKLRSSVVMTAVALGVFAGVFVIAMMNGMVEERIKTVIQTEISHLQIHKPGFRDNADLASRIAHADSLIEIIRHDQRVKGVSKRLIISSVVASATTSSGVKLIAIDPPNEQKVTNISHKIVEGDYFVENRKNSIVIGQKLAKKLKIGLHKKVVVTFQDVNQTIVSGAFRVCGIYQTNNDFFDESNVFIRYNDACALSGVESHEAHEIAVLLNSNQDVTFVKSSLNQQFKNLEVLDWLELSPEASYLSSAMDQYMFIFIIIILIALGFGIVNTMLMAVLERVKELGMLMAVGMSRWRVFGMMMLETIYLTMTGGLISILAGYAVCLHLGHTGLDLYFWKDVYASIGYSSVIYPVIGLKTLMMTTLLVMVTGIVSALYPSFKALRLNPAEATRTD
jgi:ABC-type lipoprotein release transport system permease subunit